MAITGDVFRIPIEGKDGASKSFKQIGASASKLAVQAGVASVAVNQALELMSKAARVVQSVFANTVGEFADFETALVGVGKTANLDGEELDALGKRIQSLATRIPVATGELLDIGQAAGQLGVEGADNILLFTETIAKLESASDIAGGEAASALTRILNITNENIDTIDTFASVIVRLGNNFAATESQIVRMTNEVAKSTTVFRVSSSEAAAIGTAMRALGIEAAIGGTAVGEAFQAINKTIQEGGDNFERLQELTSMTGDQLRKTFEEDSTKVFQAFIEGLNKIPAREIAGELENFDLKGRQIRKTLPVLAVGYEKLADAISQASDETKNATALNEEAQKAFDTLNSKMKTLGNTIDVIQQRIGAALAPAIELAVDALQAVSDIISRIDFKELGQSILNVTIAVGGMTAAVWASSIAWGALGTFMLRSVQVGVFGAISLATSALWLQVKALAATAGGWALVATKVALAAISFVAIAATIDIIIRNFKNLDKLLALVGASFALTFNQMNLKLQEFRSFILKLQLDFAEFLKLSDDVIIRRRKQLQNSLGEEAKLLGEQAKLTQDIADISKDIDFGFVGQLVGLFKETNKEITDAIKKAAKAEAERQAALKASTDKAKELAKVLAEISQDNFRAALGLASIGAGRSAQIELERIAAQQAVDLKEIQLEKEGKISDAIREQLRITRILIDATSGAQLAQAQLEALEEIQNSNRNIMGQIEDIGQSSLRQIQNQTRRELELLDIKRSKLEAEGLLTDEIEKQLDLQKKLVTDRGARQESEATRQLSPQLFDPNQIELLKSTFGEATSGIASSASMLAATPLAFAAAANAILDAVQQLIDFIPQIIDKTTDVINSLTDLPHRFTEALRDMFQAVDRFIRDFVPNLLESAVDRIELILDFFIEALPEAIDKLAEKIPETLEKLIDRLPELGFKFGQLLAQQAPLLGLKFSIELIKQMPRIVSEFVRQSPIIAMAIVDGFIFGIKSIINDFANLFGFGDVFNIGDDLGAQFEETADKISRSASELFEVIDLEAAQRGLDVADRIRDAIGSATNFLAKLLQRLFEFFEGIWVNVIKPIIDAFVFTLDTIWNFVKDFIIDPLIAGFTWVSDLVNKVVAKLVQGFEWVNNLINNGIAVLTAGFAWVSDLINKVIDPLMKGFSWVTKIVDKFIAPLTSGFTWVSDLVGAVEDLFKTPGWMKTFVNAVNKLTSFTPKFSAGGLVGGDTSPKQAVQGISIDSSGVSVGGVNVSDAISSFADGGVVGQVVDIMTAAKVAHAGSRSVMYAQAGSLAQGTDTIPAMLTPGEFVVNRESTRKNFGLLSSINSAKGTVAPIERPTNISVVINTKTNLDAKQIRREVMPSLERELKRKSQEGAFVISKRGLR
jgi:TP901 family phage tail tape measure protein